MGVRSYRRGKNNNPFECCNGCSNRRVGCHSKCEAFKEAKRIDEENKAAYYRDKLYIAGNTWNKGFSSYKVKIG